MRTHRSSPIHHGGADQLLARIHREHLAKLIAAVRRHASSRDEAEDAVQEAFTKACARGVPFDDEDHALRWLTVAARNRLIDERRSAAVRWRAVDDGDAVERIPANLDDSPDEVVTRRELAGRVHRTLKGMPASQRLLLWQRHAEGSAVPEAAMRVGVTAGSASVLLTRAKRGFEAAWDSTLSVLGLPLVWLAARLSGRRSDNVGYAVAVSHAAAVLAPALAALLVSGGAVAGQAETTAPSGRSMMALVRAEWFQGPDHGREGEAAGDRDSADGATTRTVVEIPAGAATVSVTQGAPPPGPPTAGVLVTIDAGGQSETVGFRYYEDVDAGACIHARVSSDGVGANSCD